jgi:mannosyltransferase OCH1-like enzyme
MARFPPALSLLSAWALISWFQFQTKSLGFVTSYLDEVDTAHPSRTSFSFPDQQQSSPFYHREASLLEFVDAYPETSCPRGLHLIPDTRLLSSAATTNVTKNATTSSSMRKIPKIVHITAKSRCMTKPFQENIDQWRFPGYSVFVHNDQAVDRLLNRHWPEFPELQKLAHCLLSGASRADLWRALVLWEYGGIYTDFDNVPNHNQFQNGSVISDSDEAFFVVEQGGWLSQYFMAATPHHPLMYLLVHKIIQRVYALNDVDGQYVPRSTGPGALKYSFIAFMGDQGPNIFEGFGDCNKGRNYRYGTVTEGLYTGWDNSTVTVVGNRKNSSEYVIRENIERKVVSYHHMNMTHFREKKKRTQTEIESCFRRIYERDLWSIRHNSEPAEYVR